MATPLSPAEQQASVPTGAMATEPALTIGQVFANKTLLQQTIAAIIALLVMIGVSIPSGLDSKLADSLFILAPVFFAIYTTAISRVNAIKQAQETREAVFSPATAQIIAKDSAATGTPVLVVPPADDLAARAKKVNYLRG